MTCNDIKDTMKQIVQSANELRLHHVPNYEAHVSYCAYFSQNEEDFTLVNETIQSMGTIAHDTKTGPVYIVSPIETVAGSLKIIKVRKPDQTRPERGDADFAIKNYKAFKTENIDKPGFKLIEREYFEMIELMDENYNVRAYFSNPPVEQHPGIREKLDNPKMDPNFPTCHDPA